MAVMVDEIHRQHYLKGAKLKCEITSVKEAIKRLKTWEAKRLFQRTDESFLSSRRRLRMNGKKITQR